jgi:hypothetical protein
MRSGILFKFIMVLLISQLCLASNQQQKKYENSELNISFSYPENWILDDGLPPPKNQLISLYSPEALETKDTTHELEKGIKIEIYSQDEELSKEARAKICASIKKNGESLKQHCSEIDGCLIIITDLKTQEKEFSIVAYIPEESNRKRYWLEYNQLILSFSNLKNDSSQ